MRERVPGHPDGSADRSRQLGARLRAFRQERGMSLRLLAERMGVTASLLSQVETGRVTPSVSTVYLAADALDVEPAQFFQGDDAYRAAGIQVTRRGHRPRLELDLGVTWENLLTRDEPGLQFLEVRYPPGSSSGPTMLRHPGRDLFTVVSGSLTFRVAFSEMVLNEGDSISYGPFTPHQVRNESDQESVAIVVTVDGSGSESDPVGRARP